MTKVDELKISNMNKIRKYFYENKILTKNDLHELTSISLAGCTNVLKELLMHKEIKQLEDADSTGGRKSKQYCLNENYANLLKIILLKQKSHEEIQSVLCNLNNQEIHTEHLVKNHIEVKDVLQIIHKYQKYPMDCILISIPGVCVNGMISICDCYALQNINLIEEIKTMIDIPVIIENDVNISVIGLQEKYSDIQNCAFIYQPATDYLGCGILINGKLYNGYQHQAGELRYLPDYSEEEQIIVQTKDPKAFLINRMHVIQAVLDPQIIGWSSDILNDEIEIENMEIKHIKDINELIYAGLFRIGIKHIVENGGNKYVR